MNLIMLWRTLSMRYLVTQTPMIVRFAILSSNFDRALNTTYQPRSEVTGVALAELFGKMLQCNQSIDIDNDLTLHVQRVNLPRGNGLKRKLAVNMGLNLYIYLLLVNTIYLEHIIYYYFSLDPSPVGLPYTQWLFLVYTLCCFVVLTGCYAGLLPYFRLSRVRTNCN